MISSKLININIYSNDSFQVMLLSEKLILLSRIREATLQALNKLRMTPQVPPTSKASSI
jgi:hypothetical protein